MTCMFDNKMISYFFVSLPPDSDVAVLSGARQAKKQKQECVHTLTCVCVLTSL